MRASVGSFQHASGSELECLKQECSPSGLSNQFRPKYNTASAGGQSLYVIQVSHGVRGRDVNRVFEIADFPLVRITAHREFDEAEIAQRLLTKLRSGRSS